MKNYIYTAGILFPLAIGQAQSARGIGGTSSGGSEFITSEENPWFIGDKPVHYCVDIDETSFSVSAEAVDITLAEVFAAVKTTIDGLKPIATPRDVLDGVPKNLTTTFVKEACSKTTELQIILGRQTSLTDMLLKNHARYTIALAHQLAFDDVHGRASGVVWITGDRGPHAYAGPHKPGEFWSFGSTLYNTLLHELGHVYGLGHDSSGVMNANAPTWSILGGTATKYSLNDIVMQHWQRTAAPVCGWLETHDVDNYILKLFDLPLKDPIHVCLNTSGANTYQLKFSKFNDQGQTLNTVNLKKTGKWSNNGRNHLNAILGRYAKVGVGSEPSSDFPWPGYHDFVPATADDVLMESSGTMQVHLIAQTHTDRVRFVLSESENKMPHYFDIDLPIIEPRKN